MVSTANKGTLVGVERTRIVRPVKLFGDCVDRRDQELESSAFGFWVRAIPRGVVLADIASAGVASAQGAWR